MNGLIVDLFAGGGGASVGIEAATGRPVDVAINHDATALAVHADNHPHTKHWAENVWKANPRQVTQGRRVGLLWASPDCKHFSVAKGGKPRDQKIRSLAWVVFRWAKSEKPDVIGMENVREFMTWGPLHRTHSKHCPGGDRCLGRRCQIRTPIKERKGETFRAFVHRLQRLGYQVEYRVLDASKYGAPTQRKRFFLIARRDGKPIIWGKPTHGGPGLLPVHTTAEHVDWSRDCPSILGRKRSLASKTLWRVAQGFRRFVLEAAEPYLVGVGGRAGQGAPMGVNTPVGTMTSKNDRALVVPVLVQTGYGERKGQSARILDIRKPHGTIVAGGGKTALMTAYVAKHFGDKGQRPGLDLREPLSTITGTDHHSLVAASLVKLRGQCTSAAVDGPAPTITAGGQHLAVLSAYLVTYYGCDRDGQRIDVPSRTITTKDRFGLCVVKVEAELTEEQRYNAWWLTRLLEDHNGIPVVDARFSERPAAVAIAAGIIVDIGLRMLEPVPELLGCQFGRFASRYDLSAARTKTAQVRLIGNSVPPELVEAVIGWQIRGRPEQLELVA